MLILLGTAQFLLGLQWQVSVPLIPVIIVQSLQQPRFMVGIADAAVTIAHTLALLLIPWLLERFSLRDLMLGFLGLRIVGAALHVFAVQYSGDLTATPELALQWLLLSRFITGFAHADRVLALTHASYHLFGPERAAGVTTLWTCNIFGAYLAPPLISFVLRYVSGLGASRALMNAMPGYMGCVLTLASCVLVLCGVERVAAPARDANALATQAAHALSRGVPWCSVGLVCFSACASWAGLLASFSALAPLLLLDEYGLLPYQSGLFYSIFAMINVPIVLLTPYLFRCCNWAQAASLWCLGGLVPYGMFNWSSWTPSGPALAPVFQFVTCFALGDAFASMSITGHVGVIANKVPRANLARVNSLFMMSIDAGKTMGPLLLVQVYSHVGANAAFLVAIALFSVATVVPGLIMSVCGCGLYGTYRDAANGNAGVNLFPVEGVFVGVEENSSGESTSQVTMNSGTVLRVTKRSCGNSKKKRLYSVT